MAYMQRTRILSDNDLDDDTTWRQRLDLSGKITAIEMSIKATRTTTRDSATLAITLADCISRIELLRDATTPLISLTGEQLDALNYWENGHLNPRIYFNVDDRVNELSLYLMGGRGFYDREYGWDFDLLDKVYLEYTYDLSEGETNYFENNLHNIELYAWQWKGDGIPNFRGFFRSKQLDAWTTTAANAVHPIQIPAANPIRRVCVQSKTQTKTLGGMLSRLELVVGKGEYSPVIIPNVKDYVMDETSQYHLHNVIGGYDYQIAATHCYLPSWWSYHQRGSLTAFSDDMEDQYLQRLNAIPASVYQVTSEAGKFTFTLAGWGFQKCLRIGFDHEADGFDLLRVPSGKALDLLCTEVDADFAAASFFQDVVSY